jgi:hypothetical protein
MRNRAAILGIAAAVTVVVACGDDSDSTEPNLLPSITYRATLSGANERPTPVNSQGTGTFVGVYDPNTGFMTYTVTYSGLGTNSTLAHIHCCGSTDQAVSALVNFASFGNVFFTPGSTSGSFNGVILLTPAFSANATINGDSLRKAMDAGLTYVNIHTTQFGGGEIRGQIVKQP